MMKIIISGYTYTRTNLFDVFESYPEKKNLFFILPNNWTAKEGRVKFKPFFREGFNIYHSSAFFLHSHYPLIGGLFKGWMPFIIFWLIWLRVRYGITILFTTGEPNLLSTLYNAVWAKLLGMRHIFHFWENIPYDQKDKGLKLKLKKMIVRANIALSDGAICGMHKAEEILRSFNPRFPIGTFLHAGFDTNRFSPGRNNALRKKLGWENQTALLYVGALGYRKGIHLVLEAMERLKNSNPDLRFLIVGSGEYENALKQKVQDMHLADVVHFMPWVVNENLPDIYRAADIFVYPSIPHEGWEEQFGYSIAEASLCGLPVVSTRTGSVDEVLLDGETGIMVKPDDKNELASAMQCLAVSPDLRKQMGTAGRKFASDNFSNDVIAGKMHDLFMSVSGSR